MPRGYKGEMRLRSEKYHKIWTDNKELTSDYGAIVSEIQALLTPGKHERPAASRCGRGDGVCVINR